MRTVRRWIAVASALMLAWTFFLGAALSPCRAAAPASRHICACRMCKDGEKSCCCKGGIAQSISASCDMADLADNLLHTPPAIVLPYIGSAPLPFFSVSDVVTVTAPAQELLTRTPPPTHSPPRCLS